MKDSHSADTPQTPRVDNARVRSRSPAIALTDTVGALALVCSLAGCTPTSTGPSAPGTAASSPVSATASGTPTGGTVVDVPPPAKKGTITRFIVRDRALIRQLDPENFDAPWAFAVEGDKIYVSVHIGQNLIYTYVDGKQTQAVSIPEGINVADMQVHDGQWYLFDSDKKIHVFAVPGVHTKKLVHLRDIPAPDQPNPGDPGDPLRVERIHFEADNLIGTMDDADTLQLLAGAGPVVQPTVTWPNDKAAILVDRNVHATIHFRHDGQGVERYAYDDGNTYYRASEVWYGRYVMNCVYLYEFGPDGSLVHTYTAEQAGDQSRLPSELVVSHGLVYRMVNTAEVSNVELLAPNP